MYGCESWTVKKAAAAAKSLQSCPTLCDPIDGSPPGSTVPGILQARTLEWVAISLSNAWKWKGKVKSLSRVWFFATPKDCSLPGSSIHGILQARVLEWVAIAFSESKEGQCQRMFKNRTTAFISHASKVMLKILQVRLQQYVNQEIPDVQAGFRKGRGTRVSKLLTPVGSLRKKGNFRKTYTCASLTMLKSLTVWITTNCGKFLKRWEYQTTLPVSWETCIRLRSNS